MAVIIRFDGDELRGGLLQAGEAQETRSRGEKTNWSGVLHHDRLAAG